MCLWWDRIPKLTLLSVLCCSWENVGHTAPAPPAPPPQHRDPSEPRMPTMYPAHQPQVKYRSVVIEVHTATALFCCCYSPFLPRMLCLSSLFLRVSGQTNCRVRQLHGTISLVSTTAVLMITEIVYCRWLLLLKLEDREPIRWSSCSQRDTSPIWRHWIECECLKLD